VNVDLRGRTVLVIGLARSGVAAAELLHRQGARVIGVDDAARSDLERRWRADDLERRLEAACVEIRTGGDWGDWGRRELAGVALSPGVPAADPRLIELARRVPIWSEVAWGARFFRGTLLAVTGTNGKSTTTALAAHLLVAAGRTAEALGNIGRPFCERADLLADDAVVVLEVSSFQLETIAAFRPRVATVLNLAPDHLDRYADANAYYAAKRRLPESLSPDGTYVTWTGCELARTWRPDGPRLLYGAADAGADVALDADAIRLTGRLSGGRLIARNELALAAPVHHLNAAAAVATVLPLAPPLAAVAAGLRSFRGLPHRHELVGRLGGVRFVDDSKATNVHAVCGGLRDYPTPVVLIAGGRGKGEDYAPLGASLAPVRAVITIGEEGPRIAEAVRRSVAVEAAPDLPAAVRRAYELARPDGTVLLSPACASFDMFRDYAERGAVFAAAARELGARDRTEESTREVER
jgi:UDP-N-acetylmuramoylalanine--D-glutamate ligase